MCYSNLICKIEIPSIVKAIPHSQPPIIRPGVRITCITFRPMLCLTITIDPAMQIPTFLLFYFLGLSWVKKYSLDQDVPRWHDRESIYSNAVITRQRSLARPNQYKRIYLYTFNGLRITYLSVLPSIFLKYLSRVVICKRCACTLSCTKTNKIHLLFKQVSHVHTMMH